MASTLQTFDFAIKDRYDKVSRVENLTKADRPLLGMMRNDTDFMGDGTHIPLIYGNPQGIAGSGLAQAQTSASNVVGKKFILTAGDYSGSVDIGDKVITASRANPGAFLKNKAAEMDGLYSQMADNIATYMYGNSGNSIGVVASVSIGTGINGGDVLTLTEPSQTINFEVGMLVDSSANDGSDTSHVLTQTDNEVQAVDRAAGTVDVGTGATSIVATEFLFRTGDFRGNTGTFIFHGLSDFLWPDSTTPPTIYSMIRTDDPQRLAGSRVPDADIAGLNIEERVQKLGAYMTGRYKGPGFTHGFMHPEDWQDLSISLQSRGVRPLKDDSTRFGYMALEVVTGGRVVRIYADRWCPKGTFFGLRLKDWTLHSMEALIHPIQKDGNVILRKATANDYEYRVVSYPSMCTVAPGYSGRVSVA